MKIGNIEVGGDNPVLVIPEIGINHEGSLQVAKEMALAASRAGARLIKHQTHIVEDEMSSAAKKVIPGNADVSIYEIMKRCALNKEEELEFKRYVESLGMEFISTPFSRAAADRLEEFGVKAYKIGSGEMNNYPLIKHIAEFGKPMIVSTGMNDIKSVAKAVDIMERYGVKYALMHTTNLYPTPTHLVRLGGMQELMKEFKGVPVGLSDHTINNNACIAAMALGAAIVERHFTDVMEKTGPDIVCSMDENTLKDLLAAAREVPKMLGGTKQAAKEEQVTIDFAFAIVVTIAPVKKGEVFTKENLWVKRPGTGEILAEYYEDLLGKTAACDIDTDVQLERRMIAE
ncbi:MAG: N-acetylneuraminate synthase family protein [Lachnospiraceae bacterium]|nr:N-acetylneuraminate synthase family protein [Lachnospiraceae bacterium]